MFFKPKWSSDTSPKIVFTQALGSPGKVLYLPCATGTPSFQLEKLKPPFIHGLPSLNHRIRSSVNRFLKSSYTVYLPHQKNQAARGTKRNITIWCAFRRNHNLQSNHTSRGVGPATTPASAGYVLRTLRSCPSIAILVTLKPYQRRDIEALCISQDILQVTSDGNVLSVSDCRQPTIKEASCSPLIYTILKIWICRNVIL